MFWLTPLDLPEWDIRVGRILLPPAPANMTRLPGVAVIILTCDDGRQRYGTRVRTALSMTLGKGEAGEIEP
jgi:hypothetical protein